MVRLIKISSIAFNFNEKPNAKSKKPQSKYKLKSKLIPHWYTSRKVTQKQETRYAEKVKKIGSLKRKSPNNVIIENKPRTTINLISILSKNANEP